ncbi:excalibur calcium-binding domain-containing protein [Gottfriedia acidiceleris]|uniref:Excalibur calcium-binding domain-containing protein n=1 Tax=Gottfriedia acidiceleris TaxID=371036 RepID=A0ABY4JNT8_9BACI|nr:excalibur calcium-binding domain-containing protein [Gottfriedia acidiceleris]UPM55513.1 excalibur calcium-binding domain-containing protein [Gottfriedia acidiceleris]
MKKLAIGILTIGLIQSYSIISTDNASAAVKYFKNCTEMHETYKGGVARSSTVKNKGGKTKYKPYVSKALYDANQKMDRDNDKIACER